jgi:hypothetical protein
LETVKLSFTYINLLFLGGKEASYNVESKDCKFFVLMVNASEKLGNCLPLPEMFPDITANHFIALLNKVVKNDHNLFLVFRL